MTALARAYGLPQWSGAAATLAIIAALELTASAGFRIPNPPAFVLLAVVFAAFAGGLRYGLICAAIGWIYFAWSFSLAGQPFQYSPENLARVVVWAAATPAMAFLVGLLRDRAGRTAAAEAEAMASRANLKALSESERRYRALADNMLEGLLILQDGRFAYASPSALTLTGYEANELLGRDFAPLVHPDFRALVAQRHGQRSAGDAPQPRYDIQIVRRSGEPLWVQIANARIEWEGRPAVLTVISDVSERKRAEQEVRRVNESLDLRVRERTSELEAFAYSVSHDLRSPLGVISGFAHMLKQDEAAALSEDGRRKLEVIEFNVAKLVRLVDDLLTLTRLTQMPLERRAMDLAALAGEVAADARAKYPGVRVEITPALEASADAALLRLALVNLFDNALKYSSKAPAPRVEFGWSKDDKAYFVRDNGIGFDMRYAGNLFRAFERLHDESDFPGTGIGLAIVQRVVARHGGRVWAKGWPGEGATFYFTLD